MGTCMPEKQDMPRKSSYDTSDSSATLEADGALRSPKQQPRQPNRRTCKLSLVTSLIACFALTAACILLPSTPESWRPSQFGHSLAKYAVKVAPKPLLQVFQVAPPVLIPSTQGAGRDLTRSTGSDSEVGNALGFSKRKGSCSVQQTLMKHSFANSYGKPFIGHYTPPNCEFNRVVFNLTVLSAGRQFDRIGLVYFGNTEIWRLSTAEPTKSGIEFGYVKDMSNYLALFKEEQKLIFDLGNLINNIYTAPFNATLTALFFSSEDTIDPADKILTVSARNASRDLGSVFQFPDMKAVDTLKLPRNIRKAFFTIAAAGQIDEEFWFGNVLSSEVDTFADGLLYPYSPFREVQLFIDGMLAGVAWPFPIIFTGGVVPGLWRPIVGIDTFDLREDEIDITPWLPLLCDGKSHTFEIKVAGISDNGHDKGKLTHKIGSYWLLTGKVFVWLDEPGSITTGSKIKRKAPNPAIQLSSTITKTADGKKNKTLDYTVEVQRAFSVSSTVKTSSGASRLFTWAQTLQYANRGIFTNHGNTQYTTQTTNGTDVSSSSSSSSDHGRRLNYNRIFTYPITTNSTYATDPKTKAFTIDATLDRGKFVQITGKPVFPDGLQAFESSAATQAAGGGFRSSILQTTQNGSAHYFSNKANTVARSSGATQQDLKFSGMRFGDGGDLKGSMELYTRHVLAVNGTVIKNRERLVGKPFGTPVSKPRSSVQSGDGGFAPARSVKKLLGHGPGGHLFG